MRGRWSALVRCFDDGRLALDNNPAERALRCVAIGRKNWLFAGSDEGASYCSSHHVLINAGYFVGDYQATGVMTGASLLHYERMRMPGQLAG
jgi:transposase